MSLWDLRNRIQEFYWLRFGRKKEEKKQVAEEQEPSGGIHISEDEEPEDLAKTIDKRKIFAAASMIVVFASAAVLSNKLFTSSPKEETIQNHGIASASTPVDQLPGKYSDIDKKKKATEKPDPDKKTNQPEKVGKDTREPLPARTPVTETRSTQNNAPAPRQVASVPASTGAVVQSDNAEAKAAEKAAKEAAEEQQSVYDSDIAFQVAAAITKEQGANAIRPLGNATKDSYDTMPVSTNSQASSYFQPLDYGVETPDEYAMLAYDDANISGSYILNAGAVIQATLLTGVTSDVPHGDVVAQVRQDICDSLTGMHLLIPQGSRLLGHAGSAGGFGNQRIGVQFYRIILPNGSSLALPEQQAIDGTGYPGLKDKYTDHSGKLYRTAFLSSILAAAAQSATGHTSGSDNRSPGQEAIAGAVASILNTGNTLVQRDASMGPTIEIAPGYQFSVFVNQDLLIGEYHDR